jgi:hypothetical protein
MRNHKLLLIFCLLFLVSTLVGCEAFVRKFTRKPKEKPKEEMVLAPEEYKPTINKEEQYRQYFLFWKSWQDELIAALSGQASQKKRLDCVNEAIKNLEQLKPMLNITLQKKLDIYLNQLKNLKDLIAKDIYGNNAVMHRLTAERLKRNILRDFPYPKIKDSLV